MTNNDYKSAFRLKMFFLSSLNFEEGNLVCYDDYCVYIQSIQYCNLVFNDDKSFVLNDMLNLKVLRDTITGNILILTAPDNVNSRTRYNLLYSIRLRNRAGSSKFIRYIVTEYNRTSDLFCKYKSSLLDCGFIYQGDINACDSAPVHLGAACEYLSDMLESFHIDKILLPSYSPELNPIKLTFNFIV